MPSITPVYQVNGYCSICEATVLFTAWHRWYRDHLRCQQCNSVPRERALALVMKRRFPDWRRARLHESSPGARGVSPKLRRECQHYTATQFFPGMERGSVVRGFRNENLEHQTFPDASFDLVVTLDVMEHVNEPAECMREIARTLTPGGAYVFTVPTYKGKVSSERRARYKPDGSIQHFAEVPEYHGSPVSEDGALVTFHYGHDLAELIHEWSGMHVDVARFHDPFHGIIGDFTEVYVAMKAS